MKEEEVVKVWQQQLICKTGLTTEDGQTLEVIYPGRPNDDRGADFRDAVIKSNRTLLHGDVEIHVLSSDWHGHGHDRDHEYNRVILHVVMRHDYSGETILQNGLSVPVLALGKFLCTSATGPPCERADSVFVSSYLDKAGDARFRFKAANFRHRLLEVSPPQVLYEGIMEALGYAKNKTPFVNLSRIITIDQLESLQKAASKKEGVILLQRKLLAAANQVSGWNTYKIRPSNSPVRRLMAIPRLLNRYREDGLLAGLRSEILRSGTKNKSGPGALVKALLVTAGSREINSFTLLGKERAGEIIVNVLLPFFYALGKGQKKIPLSRKSLGIYRDFPGYAANSIITHMSQQLRLAGKTVKTARRQQGLLHTYKEWCRRGRCSECPLSQFEAGIRVQLQAVGFPGDEAEIPACRDHGSVIGAKPDRRD